MRGVRIIEPGMYSTLQDMGRFGYREYGLPVSGVMDLFSFYHANWLVRNNIDEAVIEATFFGLELEFISPVIFAITGGNMSPQKNGKPIENWRAYPAGSGDRLRLNRIESGARSYISISGGFRIDSELGSLSTYGQGGIGGYRGRMLMKNDILPLYPSFPFLNRLRKTKETDIPDYPEYSVLKVLPGVNFTSFSEKEIKSFTQSEYTVSSQSDRMGLRLKGTPLTPSDKAQIISYGISHGSVQVPGNGEPIIMGADCQTVGGYPQIANIISAHLPLTGQLKPGDKVRFQFIDHDEAIRLWKLSIGKIGGLFRKSGPAVCTDCINKRR